MSKYRRITYEDRCQIYALSKRGTSQESIAKVLGVSQNAVSREICRNRGQRGYRFKQAEAKAQARQAIRSKAAASLETMRRQILWAAARKSRRESIELGNPRYTGHPCRHRGHGAERYTVCGGCVACARVGAERRRLERGAKVGGPMPQARHQCRSERRAAARSRRAEECGGDNRLAVQ